MQGYKITMNQGNMTSPKEYSKLPATDPKEMEIQELSDKKFKMFVLKMLRGPQENTEKEFNALSITIQEQNEKFSKEVENIRKNQTNLCTKEYND